MAGKSELFVHQNPNLNSKSPVKIILHSLSKSIVLDFGFSEAVNPSFHLV